MRVPKQSQCDQFLEALEQEGPNLRASALDAGIPAGDLTLAAVEAWARRNINDGEATQVLDGPWNDAEDLPQWFLVEKRGTR